MKTLSFLGISGSLRKASFNTSLLRVAAELAPADVAVTIYDLGDIPLYNGDDEGSDGLLPAAVVAFRQAIAAADALLIATPEYNYSVPGVLKNAIDWASRSAKGAPLNDKPAALLGAGGMSGTMRAQFHLRQILVHNNVHVLNKPEVYVARAWEKFDQAGNLSDPQARQQVQSLVESLAAWTRRLS
jgi:chromate reductase, NAD(P)H dehydrogenase (quinone)